MEGIVCGTCHAINREDAQFCAVCGGPVKVRTAAAGRAQQPVSSNQ